MLARVEKLQGGRAGTRLFGLCAVQEAPIYQSGSNCSPICPVPPFCRRYSSGKIPRSRATFTARRRLHDNAAAIRRLSDHQAGCQPRGGAHSGKVVCRVGNNVCVCSLFVSDCGMGWECLGYEALSGRNCIWQSIPRAVALGFIIQTLRACCRTLLRGAVSRCAPSDYRQQFVLELSAA
jgi:hypothetical protein